MDLLVIECSARKRDPLGMPHVLYADGRPAAQAWHVYDGNQMRICRKHAPYQNLPIWILSAEFGLLIPESAIPLYNRRMDRARANDRDWISWSISEAYDHYTDGAPHAFERYFHSLSIYYEQALNRGLSYPFKRIPAPRWSMGGRLQGLKQFLMGYQLRKESSYVLL